jgi:hypothetical protein
MAIPVLRYSFRIINWPHVKGKVVLMLFFNWAPLLEGALGEWRYSSTHSWPRHLMDVIGQLHAPAALPPGKSPWYPLDRRLGRLQSRSGHSDEEKNSHPLPGLEPPIIQPVAQRYTDWATPALLTGMKDHKKTGQKTRKMLTIDEQHHPRADTDRL